MKGKNIPDTLKHKPIFKIEDYYKEDGERANDTDAMGLSLGKCQWRRDGFEPAVKVFRHVGHWSRQSEELPLTRALDLALFIIKIVTEYKKDEHFEKKLPIEFFNDLKIEYHSGSEDLLNELKNNYFKDEKFMKLIEDRVSYLKTAIEEFDKQKR